MTVASEWQNHDSYFSTLDSKKLTVVQTRFSEWRIIGLPRRYGAWLQLKFELEIVKVGFMQVKFNIVRIVIFYSNLAET